MPMQYARRALAALAQLVLWPWRQLRGFAGRLWGFLTSVSWTEVLVPSLVGAIRWLFAQVPYAAGVGPPDKQITASIALGVAAYLSGYVTAGLTWALLIVFAGTAGIGVLRFVPVVERFWPLRGVSL